jgi:hypothetical protein
VAPRFLNRAPMTGIMAYYVVLGTLMTLIFSVWNLDELVPVGRAASGAQAPALSELQPEGAFQPAARTVDPVSPHFEPAMVVITLIGMISAFLLVLPVAWVYMVTKAHRAYDQSVPATVFILPIVITGIVIIVRDSLTLAFSLAGIVAAVRFRNTLKDTKDAVYVFLAIGVGLASGVQALDVAFVTSFSFSLLVLTLWKVEMREAVAPAGAGSGAASGPTAPNDKPITGVVVLNANDAQAARDVAQLYFEDVTKRWNLLGTATAADGSSRIEYAVRLKKSADPNAVSTDLLSRGAECIQKAEYRGVSADDK